MNMDDQKNVKVVNFSTAQKWGTDIPPHTQEANFPKPLVCTYAASQQNTMKTISSIQLTERRISITKTVN
jgi:hypothetical protein